MKWNTFEAIVGSRSLCYSAGRLNSKLPEQFCSYKTNAYLQHSAGCSHHSAGYGQDSAGCIATNMSTKCLIILFHLIPFIKPFQYYVTLLLQLFSI